MPLSWQNLVSLGHGEDVEEFLWNADIGSVIFTMDATILKNALFGCIAKFEKYPDIQSRCFQMLQECHLLAPPGIMNEELSGHYDAILRQLATWITKVDVALHGLELLSMLADKEVVRTRAVMMDSDTELIPICIRITTVHNSSKPIQRAALQLFEAIIQNAAPESLPLLAVCIFKVILDNLLLHADDNSIVYSSFCILLRLASDAKALISPYSDQFINICIEDAIVRRASPEIAAKGIAFLAYLTEDREAYFTIARHPNGFQLFIDGLDMMRAAHLTATITLFELLLRMLEDYDVALEAFQNLPLSSTGEMMNAVEFARQFQAHLKDKFEKYLTYTTEMGETVEEEEQMKVLFFLYSQVDELLMEMMRPEEEAEEMADQLKEDSKQEQRLEHGEESHVPVTASPAKPVTAIAENVTPAHSNPAQLPPSPRNIHTITNASTSQTPSKVDLEDVSSSANSSAPLTLSNRQEAGTALKMLDREMQPVDVIGDSDDDQEMQPMDDISDSDDDQEMQPVGVIGDSDDDQEMQPVDDISDSDDDSSREESNYENRVNQTTKFPDAVANQQRNELETNQITPFPDGIGHSMSAESIRSTRSLRVDTGIDVMALEEDEKQAEPALDSSVPSSGLSAKELVQLSKELNMQELMKQQQDHYIQDAEQQQALRAEYEQEHVKQFGHKPSSLESDEASEVSSPINSLTKSPTLQVATEDSANQSSADTAPPVAAVTSKPLKSSSSFLVASFSFLNSQKPNPLSHPGNATANAASTNSIITDNDNNNRGKSPQLPPGKMMVKITYIEELQESLKLANVHTRQAIQRSEMMHTLFRDAATKIEELLWENERVTNKLRAWQQQSSQKDQEIRHLQLSQKQLTQDVQSLRGQLFAYGILPCAGQSVPLPKAPNNHSTPPYVMAPMMDGGYPMLVPMGMQMQGIYPAVGTNHEDISATPESTATMATTNTAKGSTTKSSSPTKPKTLKKPGSMVLTKEKVKKIFRSPVQAAVHLPATQKPRWQATVGGSSKEKKDAAAAAAVEGGLPSPSGPSVTNTIAVGSRSGAKGTTGTTPTTTGMVGIASPPRSSVPHMIASGHFFQSPMPVPNSAAPMPYPYPPYPMPPYTMMTTTANHPAIPAQVRGIPARTLTMEGNPGSIQHQAQATAAAMSLNTMTMPMMMPPPGAFAPGMHPYMYSGPFGAAAAATDNVPSMMLSANVPSNPFAQQPSSSSSRRVSKKVNSSGLSGTKTPASNAAVGKIKHDEGEEKILQSSSARDNNREEEEEVRDGRDEVEVEKDDDRDTTVSRMSKTIPWQDFALVSAQQKQDFALAGVLEGLTTVQLRFHYAADFAAYRLQSEDPESAVPSVTFLYAAGAYFNHKHQQLFSHCSETATAGTALVSPSLDQLVRDFFSEEVQEQLIAYHQLIVQVSHEVMYLFDILLETTTGSGAGSGGGGGGGASPMTSAATSSPSAATTTDEEDTVSLRRIRLIAQKLLLLAAPPNTSLYFEQFVQSCPKKQLTLFGLAYVLLQCALETFIRGVRDSFDVTSTSADDEGNWMKELHWQKTCLDGLHNVVRGYVRDYEAQLQRAADALGSVAPLLTEPALSSVEFDGMVDVLTRERKVLMTLFELYASYKPIPMAVANANAPSTAGPTARNSDYGEVKYGGADAAAEEQPIHSGEVKPARRRRRISYLLPDTATSSTILQQPLTPTTSVRNHLPPPATASSTTPGTSSQGTVRRIGSAKALPKSPPPAFSHSQHPHSNNLPLGSPVASTTPAAAAQVTNSNVSSSSNNNNTAGTQKCLDFASLSRFCRDFELLPQLLSRQQLQDIALSVVPPPSAFSSTAAAELKNRSQSTARADDKNEKDDEIQESNSVVSEDWETELVQIHEATATAKAAPKRASKPQRPKKAHADADLTAASSDIQNQRRLYLSNLVLHFGHFLDVLWLIALRSPQLKLLSSSSTLPSPPGANAAAAGVNAVGMNSPAASANATAMKLVAFFRYCNLSSGRDIVQRRFRHLLPSSLFAYTKVHSHSTGNASSASVSMMKEERLFVFKASLPEHLAVQSLSSPGHSASANTRNQQLGKGMNHSNNANNKAVGTKKKSGLK